MRNLLLLGALGAGGYWAYQNGHLDDLIARLDGLPGQGGDALEAEIETKVSMPMPAGTSKEEALLRDNFDVVSDWSQSNLKWTAAMMWQESRGRPNAVSSAGALGLMQVMPGTAKDIHRWGWREFSPDRETLLTVRGSIYFGTAYLEYLSRKNNDREWMARAYNAGPGGQRSDGTWPRETVNYLKAVKGRHTQLIQKGVTA